MLRWRRRLAKGREQECGSRFTTQNPDFWCIMVWGADSTIPFKNILCFFIGGVVPKDGNKSVGPASRLRHLGLWCTVIWRADSTVLFNDISFFLQVASCQRTGTRTWVSLHDADCRVSDPPLWTMPPCCLRGALVQVLDLTPYILHPALCFLHPAPWVACVWKDLTNNEMPVGVKRVVQCIWLQTDVKTA